MPKLRVIIKPPPEPQGDAEQQTEALRDYLLQMSEELAYVLTHLEADNINDSTFERIQSMIPRPYTGLPVMDGDASAGQSEQWARGDHRHPTDTSRAAADDLSAHVGDTANPHGVTKAQVGLSDVANERQYSALNPPPTPSASDVGAIPATEKGSAGGVAELDANGMVPSAQLPSYVDDVLEYASLSEFPVTGESGKIYVALDTNRTYRWGGSAYVEISESLALGETSSTAYRGDRGKTAYDHSQVTSGNPHNVTAAEVGLGNVDNVQQYSALNPPPLPTPADIGAATAQDLSDHVGDTNNPHGVTAAQAGARPDTWMPTAADVGARADTWMPTAADVGARPDTWTPTAADVGAQATITASGMLKGDGLGGVSAATAGADYQAPLTSGVDYQTPLVAGTDYQTPLAAGTDYQTPLVAGTDYATPGMIPAVPDPSDATPQNLGTAAAGSSGDYSRADHVHEKPTYTASDVGLGNVDNVQQYSVNNPPPVPDAEDIPYDNTTSGLSATDLQAAVDELAQGGSAAASAVSYDNTGSGLLATDVQDAIDELANGGGGSTPAASVIPYNNTGSGLTASNVQDAIDEVLGDIPSSPSDIGAQAGITASGLLKGDGAGNISAAVSGTDYQAPLTAGTDYQTPLVAGTDYQTPLVAGTDYQTPLTAGTDYQTPLVAGTDYQTPLVAGTDYQTPLAAGADYATPGMIPSVPSPSDSTPQALGTAAAGSSGDYSRADHVHQKPSYSKSDVGLGNVDNVQQYSAINPPPYPVTSVNGSTGAVTVSVPSAYTSNPEMDGTGSPGSSGAWARGDHVHPTDTSRVPVIGMGKNLLDNAYFLDPVNQRGATSGSAGYCIDRWKASYGSGGVSWSLTSDGLSFQPVNTSSYGYIAQVIDSVVLSFIVGKRIHFHAITSSGDMIGGTIIYAANATIFDNTYSGHRVRMRFSGNELRIESYASALILKCVKFELGAEQTFAHLESSTWVPNQIPDYEYELYRCQTSTADSSDTYANKSLATEQQLAVTQVGPKANRAYAANSYFCWNGLLHRATTAISSGADLTINTNRVQTTVMDEIIRLT